MIRKRGNTYMPLVYSPVHGRKVTARVLLNEPSTYTDRATAKRAHRRMEDAAETFSQPATITVRQYVAQWQRTHPRPKKSTNDTNAYALKRLVEHFGDMPMVLFDETAARRFVALDGGRYARNAHVAKAMFNDAIRYREVPGLTTNPFAMVKLPALVRSRLALTEDEFWMLADLTPAAVASPVNPGYGQRIRAALIVSAYTGLRLGELCALRHDWIDGDQMIVRATYDPKHQIETSCKNGRTDDVIAILPPARQALDEMPRALSPYVFTLPNGARLTPSGLYYYWKTVRGVFLAREHSPVRRAQLAGLKWHTLRHTHSTLLAQAGFNRWEIAAQMRHSTPELVDLTYTNIDAEKTRAAMVERFRKAV
jgi:integrase